MPADPATSPLGRRAATGVLIVFFIAGHPLSVSGRAGTRPRREQD
jgi:hypothetical protein